MAGNEKLASEKRPATEHFHPGELLRLVVNGDPTESRSATLGLLLEELGYGGRRVATAVNGEFVAEKARSGTVLASGDAIEVVSPRQGG